MDSKSFLISKVFYTKKHLINFSIHIFIWIILCFKVKINV